MELTHIASEAKLGQSTLSNLENRVMLTSWQQVVAYAISNHLVLEWQSDLIKLVMEFENGRSQFALLRKLVRSEAAGCWLALESPIGAVDEHDLTAVVQRASRSLIGGVSMFGGLLVLRHTFHVPSLRAHEFDRDLYLLCRSADEIEHELLGSDAF